MGHPTAAPRDRLTPPEREFLYALGRWAGAGEPPRRRSGPLREEVLFPCILRNGCAGILYQGLEDGWAPEFAGRDSCRDQAMGIEWSNAVYRAAASRLDAAARRLSIPYVAIKGAALLATIYPESGIRPLSDLDLIVASREDALRLVRGLGLDPPSSHGREFIKRFGEYDRLARPWFLEEERAQAEIEIHFPVPDSPYSLSEFIGLACGPILEGSRTRAGVRVIDPTHHLVLLLLHLIYQHLGAKLIWHVDIARLIRLEGKEIDWGRVLAWADRLGYRAAFAAVLASIRDRLGAGVPAVATDPIAGGSTLNRGVLRELASPGNVLEDVLGGQAFAEIVRFGLAQARPAFFFAFFPSLFRDRPKSGLTYVLSSPHGPLLGQLIFIALTKYRWLGRFAALKRFIGRIALALSALIVFPVHLHYNRKWRSGAAGRTAQ
jgi:hypothetical protein